MLNGEKGFTSIGEYWGSRCMDLAKAPISLHLVLLSTYAISSTFVISKFFFLIIIFLPANPFQYAKVRVMLF